MPIFKVYKNNNLVFVAKKQVDLLKKMSEHSIKGLSGITIRRKLKDNNELIKDDIKITKEEGNNRKNKKIESHKEESITTYKGITKKEIIFKTNLIINRFNYNDFIKLIIDKLNKLGNSVLSKNLYQINLIKDTDNKNSTTYLPYNAVINSIQEIIIKLLEQYDEDTVEIKKIMISYYEAPNLDEVVIFGNKKINEFKDDDKTRRAIINNLIKTDENHKKIIKLLSNYNIISPCTVKNCLLFACFIASYKSYDIGQKVKDYIKSIDIQAFNVKSIIPDLCHRLKKKICVYYVADISQSKKYGLYDDEIKILIYGSHAYALLEKSVDVKQEQYTQKLIEKPIYKPDEKKYVLGTFDFETCNEEEKQQEKNNTIAYMGGVYFDGIYKDFQKKEKEDNVINDFLNYIFSKKTPNNLILYAHNGGKFDTYLLLNDILKSKDYIIKNFMEQSGRIINLVIYNFKNKKEIIIRDSINLIAGSLDSACKSFKPDTVKLDGDVNHDLININNCHTNEIYNYVYQYLKNDCISLYEILKKFDGIIYNAYGFNIKDVLTNASIARRVFLEKYYKEDQYELTPDIDDELRKYYYGGRNEVMTKLGHTKEKLFYVDFTSLYPYVMNKYKYQKGLMTIEDIREKEFNKNWFGFVKLQFRHKEKKGIPLHAVIKDHKLIFPYVDTWTEAIISTVELNYSIDNNLGYEYKFITLYNYNETDLIFKEVTDDLYKMKLQAQKENNPALRSIAKIIINSCYGFWGMNYLNRDQKVITKEYNDKEKKNNKTKSADDKTQAKINDYLFRGKLKDYRNIHGYDVYNINDSIKAKCVNVGIASMITSYARLELYKLLKKINDKGGKIYYMDTDSVITDYDIYKDKDFKNYIGEAGENLGELTNEALDLMKGEIIKYHLSKIEGNEEEKTKIYNEKYKKQVNNFIDKHDINYKKGNKNKNKNSVGFDELITLGNKMYALNKSFEYDNTKLNICITKMKGINAKNKYDNKTIEENNIIFSSINKISGEKKISFEDYKLISDGYNLIVDNMNFITGIDDIVIKKNKLIKLNNTKKIKKLYDKGTVNDDNSITPLII